MNTTIGNKSNCLFSAVNAFMPIENSITFSLICSCDIIKQARMNNDTTSETSVVACKRSRAIATSALTARAVVNTLETSCAWLEVFIDTILQPFTTTTKTISSRPTNPKNPNVPKTCKNSLYALSNEKLHMFSWLNSAGL